MSAAIERLRTCLGGPEWSWLRQRLRRCLAQERPLPTICRRTDPSPAEWEAVASLMGRPAGRPGKELRVRPAELEARLRHAELCGSLREALELLDGPIPSLPAAARREREAWDALADELARRIQKAQTDLAAHRPDLHELMERMAPAGGLEAETVRALCGRDLSVGETLREALARVFDTLSELGPGPVPRAHLAARALGDSHALDANTVPARAFAALAGRATASISDMWSTYSVLVDEVSSSVLILNLRFEAGPPLPQAVNGFAAAGEPCRILLRHVARLSPVAPRGGRFFVCENPSILEAAALALGADCPPMICTEGQPSQACQALLTACAKTAGRLCYHGDYDWGGIRIANLVWRIVPGTIPWRYDADHYRVLDDGFPLSGSPAVATWDPHLEPAMRERGQGFHEEQVLPELLHDLGVGGCR